MRRNRNPVMSTEAETRFESSPGTAIPFYAPSTGARERELLEAVLDSNYLNDGDVTREFERLVASATGVEHCVAVTSGTAAIALALMALGVGAGDEVIVPDLTFIATANAVRLTGADVRLVDIEPRSFSIDPERLEKAIGPRTKAVVPVDVNGRSAAYGEIARICDSHGLEIVCDAAEGLGSAPKGKVLGSFGRAGCFSFSANKRICTGQGGAVVTNDAALAARVRELKDQGRRVQGTGGDDLHPALGFNFKFTNLQAAVGVAQMESLAERVAQARALVRWYREPLEGCPGIVIPETPDDGTVLQWFDILVSDRPRLSQALRERGIGHRAFWRPLHTQPPYRAKDEPFPKAIEVARRGIWLPSSATLTQAEARSVAEAVRAAMTDGVAV